MTSWKLAYSCGLEKKKKTPEGFGAAQKICVNSKEPSPGDKTKVTKNELAQGKWRMIKEFGITLAGAMAAQTAWLSSPLLCQLYSDGCYRPFS